MTVPEVKQLLATLAEQIRPQLTPETALVGIHTGGVWVAERLHTLLGISQPLGSIDVAFYRDDYNSRGLHGKPQRSGIPFDVADRHIILVDDVLYSGRTTRAALNELFDYGRPARVDLAVLVDRGERQLPIAARFCAHTLAEPLPAGSKLSLRRDDHGNLSLEVKSA
ncbi:bifunctional pyr operon transcriptional regulator/uracil phosphoribosyltransferase PyrR [Uliginosibacterium flavum]|uniref:Bifunctional pyr operon transcriptional regulator/uracil phosphoribosyltransferase PyrR n=1 Tax=Uliginosibacterium flavum TaxID=1396831 RepID=A0ABV2TM33_9RHOO